MADHSTEIAALEALINSAASGVTVGNTSTRFDLEQARKRLAELRQTDDASIAAKMVRPRVTRIKIGGAW